MSKTFQPRQVESDAWKTWHKDSLRLIGRVGVVWLALWILVVSGVAWQAAMATKGSAWFLLVLMMAQMLGVLSQPFIQAVLDQAARAERISIPAAAQQAAGELLYQWRWFARRIGGQVVAFLVVTAFMVGLPLLLLAAGQSPESSATPSNPNPLTPVASLVVFFSATPLFLRKHGILDFRYWLRVRHGTPEVLSPLLHAVAQQRNAPVFLKAVAGLMAIYFVIALLFSPVALLVAVPILQWYLSAYVRCAYYDVFEDGTGLTEKAKQESTTMSATPVLQA